MQEEVRANQELLEDSRQAYLKGFNEAEKSIHEQVAQGDYIYTMSAPSMMPSDV